jgi:hypothetical protein
LTSTHLRWLKQRLCQCMKLEIRRLETAETTNPLHSVGLLALLNPCIHRGFLHPESACL